MKIPPPSSLLPSLRSWIKITSSASEGSGAEWSHKVPQFTIVCRLSRRHNDPWSRSSINYSLASFHWWWMPMSFHGGIIFHYPASGFRGPKVLWQFIKINSMEGKVPSSLWSSARAPFVVPPYSSLLPPPYDNIKYFFNKVEHKKVVVTWKMQISENHEPNERATLEG